jgi:hypothetical protein
MHLSKISISTLFLSFCIALYMQYASAQLPDNISPLLGNWINANASSTGITRIEITQIIGGIQVHATRTTCTDDGLCDLGFTGASPYMLATATKAKHFTAVFSLINNSTVYLTGSKVGTSLELRVYYRYPTGDSRVNSFKIEQFVRES